MGECHLQPETTKKNVHLLGQEQVGNQTQVNNAVEFALD
jgi:hypothetical protein